MNDFDSEDRLRDRGNGHNRREGGSRRRGGGLGDEMEFGYKENGQGSRTRRPPRGMGNFGRNTARPFQNPHGAPVAAPQFRQYDNPGYFNFEGRGRGWGREQRYSRGGGGGGYIRNRNPQDNYYNDAKFQGANRPLDTGVGYVPDQEGRRRRRPNNGMRRYENSNENENTGYERRRYGDNTMRGRYRRGGRGRGQMRNYDFAREPYNNRGGQGGRRTNRGRYPPNSGKRGQRRNQRDGNQRTSRPEEKKVPFLIETLQIQSMSDIKSDTDENKKEKPETTIPNAVSLHYWDAPIIENLPPLEEK